MLLDYFTLEEKSIMNHKLTFKYNDENISKK